MAIAGVARALRRAAGAAVAVFLAGMFPWWVVWLIEPRPNRVLFGLAEATLGLADVTLELVVGTLWVNGAILASDMAGAGLLAYFASGGRPRVGWLWGLAVGVTSFVLSLWDPLFLALMPTIPGRIRYWPDDPPIVFLLRDLMLSFHLLAVVFLPQVGGMLGAMAARRRRACNR